MDSVAISRVGIQKDTEGKRHPEYTILSSDRSGYNI